MTIYVAQGTSGRGPLNVGTFPGVDPTGTSDSTAAILAAIQASLPNQGIYVPFGTYKLNSTLDFSALTVSSAILNWQMVCDQGAVFKAGAGLGANPMIKLVAPAGQQFLSCSVQLPTLTGNVGAVVTSQHGLVIGNFSDGYLSVMRSQGFDIGVKVDQITTNTFPCGNNQMLFELLGQNNTGFASSSPASGLSFQGNNVIFGDVIANTANGIVSDANGTGHQGWYNRFTVGSSEGSGGAGILEFSQHNIWQVNNTNSNTNTGFVLASGAGNKVVASGYFTDGFNVNGQSPTLTQYN